MKSESEEDAPTKDDGATVEDAPADEGAVENNNGTEILNFAAPTGEEVEEPAAEEPSNDEPSPEPMPEPTPDDSAKDEPLTEE